MTTTTTYDTSVALNLFNIRQKAVAAGESSQSIAAKLLDGLIQSGYETDTNPTGYLSRVKFENGMIIVGTAFQSLKGTDGDDIMWGGSDTSISGGAGNDIIRGGPGATMNGGDGDDYIQGIDISAISGGAGNDTIYGDNHRGTDHATIDGGAGNDTIYASDRVAVTDLLGDNLIDISSGSVTVGDGNNTIYASASNVTTGDGNNTIDAWNSSTVVTGNGNNEIEAWMGSKVTAGAGNDKILAIKGSVVDAGAGDDYIQAGGASTVTGGLGNDEIRFSEGSTVLFSAGDGHDRLFSTRSDSTLQFGAGLTADKMHVEVYTGGATITFEGNETDKITVQLADPPGTVGRSTIAGTLKVVFQDGTTRQITAPSYPVPHPQKNPYAEF